MCCLQYKFSSSCGVTFINFIAVVAALCGHQFTEITIDVVVSPAKRNPNVSASQFIATHYNPNASAFHRIIVAVTIASASLMVYHSALLNLC